MPIHADIQGQNTANERAGHDAVLIAQLQCIHVELRGMLAAAAQTPASESDEAFMQLCREINGLARKFLRLSEKLLAGGETVTAELPVQQKALVN